jgi:ADP-heptose:LPS heptosyltransferase
MSALARAAAPAPGGRVSRKGLVVRLDGAGDMLLAGPAIRAVAAHCEHVTVLAGPGGADAARLLPGVNQVLVWRSPWIDLHPPPVRADDVAALTGQIGAGGFTDALVLTSFHQSPLPTALVLRLAGVPRIAAISADFPGSLLDVRHRVDEDIPEAERGLSLAWAAGFDLPPGDDGRLAVRAPVPGTSHLTGAGPYLVLHPGATAPARQWPKQRWEEAVTELTQRGRRVVLTGGPAERSLTAAAVAAHRGGPADQVIDLGGRTDLAQLAGVLAAAAAVIVGNTGVAHLAAAVGTPVVSLFAPVVPAVRWAPYGVPHVLLGDQFAPCRDTRAVTCPVAGHPCLADVTAAEACDTVDKLIAQWPKAPARPGQPAAEAPTGLPGTPGQREEPG